MDNQSITPYKSQLPSTMLNSGNGVVSFETDTKSAIRKGFWVLIVGFGVFLLWAAFAPLDEGVPTEGMVSIETKSKVIQHLNGGIVDQVNVKEGQFVKKGEVLLTIDAALTKAKFEEIRQHYLGLRSNESRLVSEQSENGQIEFHPDLMNSSADPNVRSKMTDQNRMLQVRKELLNADIAQISESIRAEEASIQGNELLLQNKRTELQLVKQQLSDISSAVDEGFVPRVQQSELNQKVAQLNGDISQTTGNIMKSRRVILELRNKINARRQTDQKEVEEELAKVRLEVDADAEKFKAIKDELARTEIKAPVDGQVIGLQVQTSGGIIQPGQKLMSVVPVGERLLLDAKIPPHLIDRIQLSQPADVRFSSFAHTPQLMVDGKVVSISTDIIADPATQNERYRYYYLARVEVTDKGMKTLGKRQLKPGMPVQIVINTGERTFLTYLMHPLIKRVAASLKEE